MYNQVTGLTAVGLSVGGKGSICGSSSNRLNRRQSDASGRSGGGALLHEDAAAVLSCVSEEERLHDPQLAAALHADAATLQTAFPFNSLSF